MESMVWPIHTKKLKRGPQVVLPKDAGAIIAYSGICKESFVLDAGAGSGWLAVQLGMIAKRVIAYDNRPEFAELAQKNAKRAGLDNVEVRVRNIIEQGFDEAGADVITLDMASSDKVAGHAFAALKEGGVLVGYMPHTEQLKAFVMAAKAAGFEDEVFSCEIIIRGMLVRDAGVRPENTGLTHTGYLAFARKPAAQINKQPE